MLGLTALENAAGQDIGGMLDAMLTKRCKRCKEIRPADQFVIYKLRSGKDGTRSLKCKACLHKQGNDWARSNKEKRLATAFRYLKNKEPRSRLYHSLYHAVKRRPSENPITLDELVEMYYRQGGKCALSGVELTFGTGNGATPTSCSIDRIEQGIGYEKDNVRLVAYCVNAFRNTMNDESFWKFVGMLYERSPK